MVKIMEITTKGITNEASMSLSKNVANNFTQTLFSLRDMIKIVPDQSTVIPRQPIVSLTLHNMISSFIKKINRKNLREGFLGYPWLRWPKISEIINGNSHCDS